MDKAVTPIFITDLIAVGYIQFVIEEGNPMVISTTLTFVRGICNAVATAEGCDQITAAVNLDDLVRPRTSIKESIEIGAVVGQAVEAGEDTTQARNRTAYVKGL
jgi:hypothetical protein